VAGRASAPGRVPREPRPSSEPRSGGGDVMAGDEQFDATALDWAGWTKQDAVADYVKSVISKAVDHDTDGEDSRP